MTEDGTYLVLMTIANAVYRVDTSSQPFEVDDRAASTGLATHRLQINKGYAYVVNSLSNNLQRIELSNRRSERPFTVFDVGSNPLGLAMINTRTI